MCTQVCQEGTHECQEWTQAFLTCIKEVQTLKWFQSLHLTIIGIFSNIFEYSVNEEAFETSHVIPNSQALSDKHSLLLFATVYDRFVLSE
jgi:hypothetical protein